jgi:hypothetical protein
MPTTTLTLEVQPGTDVLQRIVCVCGRRNVDIVALSYLGGQITLTVGGDPWHTRRLGRWLSALVNVLSVGNEPATVPRGSGQEIEDGFGRPAA